MLFQKNKERWYIVVAVFVFVLAFALRVIGANWGMPHDNLHPDEGLIFKRAYECALEHRFEIHEYYRPNHVSIKLNTLLYLGIQEFYFEPMGMSDFALNYSENFALFTTASRVLMALCGVGVVAFGFCIGHFWGKAQALLTAFLFAIFPSFIEHSHYLTPDMPLLFFLLGVLWAGLCYYKKQATHWIFWMAFFTALATCEKYPGIYGCVMIAVVICVTHYKKPVSILKNGLLAILFVILGILAISPVLIVDLETVLEVMSGQNKQYHIGADGLNFGQTIWFYLQTTGVRLGLIATVTAIYGMIQMFRHDIKLALIFTTIFVYIFPISVLSVHWERYTLPIYAAGLFWGAYGAICLAKRLHEFFVKKDSEKGIWKRKKLVQLCTYAIVFLLPVGSMMVCGLATTVSFLAPDTRILLQDDFAAMNITRDNASHDCNTPLDPGGFYGAFGNYVNGDPHQFKYGALPRYIVTSSAQRDIFLAEKQEVYGWVKRFYERVDEDYSLIYCYPAELPKSHFIELENIWYNAKKLYRYIFKNAAVGYEIRIYERVQ